jgi:hypothetical protein
MLDLPTSINAAPTTHQRLDMQKRNTTHIHSIFHRTAAKTSTQAVAKARGWRTGMPYTAFPDFIMLGPSTVLLLLLPTQRRMHTCICVGLQLATMTNIATSWRLTHNPAARPVQKEVVQHAHSMHTECM